jgi:hypothetical protein
MAHSANYLQREKHYSFQQEIWVLLVADNAKGVMNQENLLPQ